MLKWKSSESSAAALAVLVLRHVRKGTRMFSFGSKHALYKTAHEQVMHSLKYAYRDRRQLKREMRKLWIARINAACRMNDMSYSTFMHGLKLAEVNVNRKMLSEIAIADPEGFKALTDLAKEQLAK